MREITLIQLKGVIDTTDLDHVPVRVVSPKGSKFGYKKPDWLYIFEIEPNDLVLVGKENPLVIHLEDMIEGKDKYLKEIVLSKCDTYLIRSNKSRREI